jgi:hypothetical protein
LALSAQEATPIPVDPAAELPIIQPAEPPTESLQDNQVLPGISSDTFTTVVIAGTSIILGLIGAYAYAQKTSTTSLYRSLPPEATTFIQMVLEYMSTKAVATPSAHDDERMKSLITALGYSWQQSPDGRVILTPIATSPTPSFPPLDPADTFG